MLDYKLVDSYQRQKDQQMKDITNMNQHIEDIEDINYKRHIDNMHPSKSSKKLWPFHNVEVEIMDEVA